MICRRLVAPALLLTTVAVLSGCDSTARRYGASGSVTYKDQPVKSGLISFVPKGSTAPAGGAAITDGTYEVPSNPGLPPGEYEVIISVPKAAPGKAAKEEEGPGEGGEKETAETLPARYNAKTELRAEVKAGEKNEFDFHLK